MKTEKDESCVIRLVPDRIGLIDIGMALLASGIVYFLLTHWVFPCIYPTYWEDMAFVVGARRPRGVFPGIWREILRFVFNSSAEGEGVKNIMLLGRVLGAGVAFLFYFVVRQLLSCYAKALQTSKLWSHLVAPVSSFTGAVFIACAHPIWCGLESASAHSFLLLLSLFTLCLIFRFIRHGSYFAFYSAMVLSGFITSETPIGLLLPLFMMYIHWRFQKMCVGEDFMLQRFNAAPLPKWLAFFPFIVGLGIGVYINIRCFKAAGGYMTFEWRDNMVHIYYAIQYGMSVIKSASVPGIVAAAVMILVPFITTMLMLDYAFNGFVKIPFYAGMALIFAGIMSLSQLSMCGECWFWEWVRSENMINSVFLLYTLMTLAALTISIVFAAFLADAFIRKRVKKDSSSQVVDESDSTVRSLVPIYRVGIIFVLLAAFALVIPGRALKRERGMLKLIDEFVKRTVTESSTDKWIFTDGSLDLGFEIESALRGKRLFAISFMSGKNVLDVNLRRRGLTQEEDREAARFGAGSILRTWRNNNSPTLNEISMQLGFQLWRRDHVQIPDCGATLARPAGMTKEARIDGYEFAKQFSERLLEFANDLEICFDSVIREDFLFVMWRISRMALMSAMVFDAENDGDRADGLVNLSQKLDDANLSLKHLKHDDDFISRQTIWQMTPREKLDYGLKRADFADVVDSAKDILSRDETDADANFAMAMYYADIKVYTQAEKYLERCVKKNNREPAFFNNLALVKLKLKKYEEAQEYANKASALAPDIPEIRQTLRAVKVAVQQIEQGVIKDDK